MRKGVLLICLLPLTLIAGQVGNPLTDALQHQLQKPAVRMSAFTFIDQHISAGKFDEAMLRKLPEMNNSGASCKLVHNKTSLTGKHLFYEQFVKGIKVCNSYIGVNLNHEGQIISIFNHLTDVSQWQELPIPNRTDAAPILLPVNGLPELIYEKQNHYFKNYIDRSGKLIYEIDQRLYFSNEDTIVAGKVFQPDPITPSGLTYGQGGILHYNDSDYADINSKRVDITFPATLLNDTFYLENKYARITDLFAPYYGRAKSKTPSFDFTRKTNAFKEVMCLFHISNLQNYLESIGLDGLVPYAIKVDAHGSFADLSAFHFTPDTFLTFGLGGVPDAEDADVIIHEYTHAISFTAAPSGVVGIQRRALEEANCDVMAATYSKVYATHNWRYIFNWDGPNPVVTGQFPFWSGRNANSAKKYSDTTNNFYTDSEIWSSCILDIAEELNRETLLKLLIASMHAYTPNTTMAQAAQLFIDADSILFNKQNAWKIGKQFVNRQLGTFNTSLATTTEVNGVQLLNTAAFAEGNGNLIISSVTDEQMLCNIYDMTGKLKYETSGESRLMINPELLSSGVYSIEIIINNKRQTMKVVRF